jgi:MFS family permease
MSTRLGVVPELPHDAWVVLGADALSALGSGLTLPFFLIYLYHVRRIPLGLAGLAVSMVAFGSVFGNLTGGMLSDRRGARNTVILGLMIAAAGAAVVTLVRQSWQAFAAAGTVGLGAGVIWPAQDALLASVVRAEQRSSVFSVRLATLNVGLGTGALLAATIVNPSSAHSFVTLYVLDGVSFLVAIPLLLTVPTKRLRDEHDLDVPASGGYRQVLKDKVFVRVWALTVLLITLGYGQLHSAFPAYATRPGGIPVSALGLAFAANTFTVVVAQLAVLKMMAGRRRTTGILAACACWAATWGLTLLAGQAGRGPRAISLFVLAMVLFALAETFLSPSLAPIVNDLAPSALRGRYNGLSTLAWTGGFLIGPAIAGFALSAGLASSLFVALIIACSLAAAATLRLQRHLPEQANTVQSEAR